MTPNQIKSELILRDIKLVDIAAALGVKSSGAISGVILRYYRSRRVAAEIARRIGKPVEAVFPELASQSPRGSQSTSGRVSRSRRR